MTRRAHLVVVRLLSLAAAAFALLPRPASAWWETTVTTNKWEYDGVEYLESTGTQYIMLTNGTVDSTYGAMAKYSMTAQEDNYPIGFGSTNNKRFLGFGANSTHSGWIYGWGTVGTFTSSPQYSFTDYPCGLGNPHVFSLNFLNSKKCSCDGSDESTISAATESFSNTGFYLFKSYSTAMPSRFYWAYISVADAVEWNLVPVLHEGEGKMLDLVHGTLYANAGTGAFTYGAVTGTVTYAVITTNRVYHANPPASAYDALSPWNAPDRTRLGGDARTLRPSAQIVP